MTLREIWQKIKARVKKYDDEHNFTCDICGREVFENERICKQCYARLPWNDEVVCPLCGRKEKEAGICLECKRKPPEFDRARSCFTHEGEAARLVVQFKRGKQFLYRTLCDCLEPLMEREFPEADAVTFVPMAEHAERARGYNQSKLLAEELARRSGKELLSAVEKKRETNAQKTLSRKEREENLSGCFHVTDRKAFKDKKIVIVDDTMTTGSTADELARTLFRAGARDVFVLTATSVQDRTPYGKKPS